VTLSCARVLQVLQEAPVTDPSNTETPVAPAPFAVAPVAPVAFAESPVAPAQVAVAPETPVAPAPVAVAPVAPVAFAETPVAPAQVAVAPETPVAPAPVAVAPVAAVAPVVAAAPLPQPPVAPAPRATSPAIGAAAAKLQEAEAPAPTPFNADIDNGGARSYGMQKTEDGKKDWSTIGQVHGGKVRIRIAAFLGGGVTCSSVFFVCCELYKQEQSLMLPLPMSLLQTMAQAGGMGSAGPATAEAGLDETLEDYAKVLHAPGYLNGRRAECCKMENVQRE